MDEKVLITQANMDAIGNAIRYKNGLLTKYLPSEMPSAIEEIPNSYTAEDEGKVVKNGALVAQTARAAAITENATYDTTENNSVTVNVQGSGGGASTDFVKGDSVIPQMTSDTTPSGTASSSSVLNASFAAYRAFDGLNTVSSMQGGWLANSTDTDPYLQYTWENDTGISSIEIFTANNGPTVSKNVEILGLTSGGTWENCLATGSTVTLEFLNGTYGNTSVRHLIRLNCNSYHGIKIQGHEPFYGGTYQFACTFDKVQVYKNSAGVLPGLGYYGTSDPDSSLGTDGNIYTDLYTGISYQKHNGSWSRI